VAKNPGFVETGNPVAILQKWVPYSRRYLFNAIPDTNHNANPTNHNRYNKGNPNPTNLTNPNTRYRYE